MELGWQTLSKRRKTAKLITMYRMVNQIAPGYLVELLNDFWVRGVITTRGQVMGNFTLSVCKPLMHKKSFICSGISLWNQLDPSIKGLSTLHDFKCQIKSKSRVNAPMMIYNVSRKIQNYFHPDHVGFF